LTEWREHVGTVIELQDDAAFEPNEQTRKKLRKTMKKSMNCM